MNYRHHFHAGNFADVAKHVLLGQLIQAMQRKEKGFLYLDTHAGRGCYDLAGAGQGDWQERRPEHPEGIGRLLAGAARAVVEAHPALRDYVRLVKNFDVIRRESSAGKKTDAAGGLRFYPGSPAIAKMLARPQDRLLLCEKHPEEFAGLQGGLAGAARVSVQQLDGYTAVRAALPPPEKRVLVLIDPPFEAQDEFSRVLAALREGLRRSPGATFAIWYPMTDRADAERFFARLETGEFPPTLTTELTVAGEDTALKMRGTGLAVINPPWQFDLAVAPVLTALAGLLEQTPGGRGAVRWIVPER